MNRSDSIEQFIRNHRDAFDAAVPGAHCLHEIGKTLDRLRTADDLERELLYNRVLLDTEMPSAQVWKGVKQQLDRHNAPDMLEQFIRNNREALDSETPDLKVWSQVIKSIPFAPKRGLFVSWRQTLVRVAASLALLLAGVAGGIWYAQSDEPPTMAMSEISNEYAELETYYKRDIASKRKKLASFTGSQPAEVYEDMDQLDDVMEELQHELAGVPSGNREQVVRAMIENYKAKAAILERVLERLESSKMETKNSDNNDAFKNI